MTELGSCSVSLSYLGDEGDMRKKSSRTITWSNG